MYARDRLLDGQAGAARTGVIPPVLGSKGSEEDAAPPVPQLKAPETGKKGS